MKKLFGLATLGLFVNVIISCSLPVTPVNTNSAKPSSQSPSAPSNPSVSTPASLPAPSGIPTKEQFINSYQCIIDNPNPNISQDMKNQIKKLIDAVLIMQGQDLADFLKINAEDYNKVAPLCNSTSPVSDSNIDNSFFKPYFPTPVVGLKYSFIINQTLTRAIDKQTQNSTSQLTKEIISITGNDLKIRVTDANNKSQDVTSQLDHWVDTILVNNDTSIKVTTNYNGNETLKLPAGEFKDAAKVTTTIVPTSSADKSKKTYQTWYAKGIGTIKTDDLIIDNMGNQTHIVVELSSYKIPGQ